MSTTYRDRIAASKSKLRSTAEPVAAALALAALAGSAQAVTIYTVADPAFNYMGLSINPFTGTYATLGTFPDATNPIMVGFCGGGTYSPNQSNLAWNGSGSDVTMVSAGSLLDNTSTFGMTNTYGWGYSNSYSTVAPNYLTFKYSNQGTNSDETYYGWVEFNYSSYQTQVTRFALGSNDESVTVGAVPEPSSFVFSIVAGGLLLTRRKRSA
jgi:hypothetical protein